MRGDRPQGQVVTRFPKNRLQRVFAATGDPLDISATSNVVMTGHFPSSTANSSRYSSVASLRLATPSSTVLPWLTVPNSGHSATYYLCPLKSTAVNVLMDSPLQYHFLHGDTIDRDPPVTDRSSSITEGFPQGLPLRRCSRNPPR